MKNTAPGNILIFSDNHILRIEKSTDANIKVIINGNDRAIDPNNIRKEIAALVNDWEEKKFPEVILQSPDLPEIFDAVKSAYDRFIIAAGGLVVNSEGKLLMIYRNGKWDLPKGKIEMGEKIAEGALREVKEETGLKTVEIEYELLRTYHTYALQGKRVLKETVWYLMKSDDVHTAPQLNEGITLTEWIAKERLPQVAENTYENILMLLKKHFNAPSL